MIRMALFAVLAIVAATAGSSAQTASPYAGQEQRAIKALSDEEIRDLLEARGMGLAKAAELNSYPGPLHVLQLAAELGLSDAQRKGNRCAVCEHATTGSIHRPPDHRGGAHPRSRLCEWRNRAGDASVSSPCHRDPAGRASGRSLGGPLSSARTADAGANCPVRRASRISRQPRAARPPSRGLEQRNCPYQGPCA